MRACAPFGVDDPTLAAGMVRQQAELAATAHLQRQLENAEAEEAEVRDELETVLEQTGVAGTDIASRVAVLEDAVANARRRDQARTHVRSREEIEAELGRLEAQVRHERRPEWGSNVEPDDSEEPNVTDLQRRRAVAAQAYDTALNLVPDVEHLADRKAAVERRVHVLESSLESSGGTGESGIDIEDVRRQLIARLTEARKGSTPLVVGSRPPEILSGPRDRLPLAELPTTARTRFDRAWTNPSMVGGLLLVAPLK